MKLGHSVWLAGPAGEEFSNIAGELGLPLLPLRMRGLKIRAISALAGLIRRHEIQIVHARHGRDYWPAILAARISGRRPVVVLSRHLAKSPSSWASRHFLLNQCHAMAAVSEFVAKVLREGDSDPDSENLERHFRPPLQGDTSKIHVVYGGFDMERFQPSDASAQRAEWGLAKDHFAFGVVGAYHAPRGKGQPEFLRAAAEVRKDLPQARFLIIGRGDMKEILQKQIQELHLEEVARLTPYSHDMPSAMNALDCLVLPQVGTEAIPGVVLEAYACGKPVIASDLDGIPEAVRVSELGQLVKPGSIPELANAMIECAKRTPPDAAMRRALHDKVAEKFSLERAALGLAALFENLVEKRRRRP